ncbi:uncharacterized protein LDX57_004334 [Aspergillus melleus]|uniref:uncharacterized protein n=1 Tax=Aspergillus melleus TaxID=138277 RepID=UPI001E8CC728|nr:uncharacterized protein LDX57_004334 [Aspergillus melleus]KAH8426599.1 hypothetical protein LDX57_004334 [Aspergillus melleus]
MPARRQYLRTATGTKKGMRKGTRSCLACRQRKVRCWFPSPQSSVCVHCARRKAACVAQGPQHEPDSTPEEAIGRTNDPGPPSAISNEAVSFFDALESLKRRIDASLMDSQFPDSPNQQAKASQPSLAPDLVQSECAPVMQLLNHRLVRSASTVLPDDAEENSDDPMESPHFLREMCATLPSNPEIATIFNSRSGWWEVWREAFGLAWGHMSDSSLEKFATRAVRSGRPSSLGSLLICFAFSTGEHDRYLAPVERWALSDEGLSAHEEDFQCMMGLGLGLLSALQPRRAWIVYRKANTLLQLAGIHRTHRRSESLDLVFWQLFGADRWASLLVGLPYSVPDRLCDLYIPPLDQSSPIIFHSRHMTLLTGRVIDCLQSSEGLSLAAVVAVGEEIDKVTSQLPRDYLSMGQIFACREVKEQSARLYRLMQIYQLKTFLYLPLFLQDCEIEQRQEQNLYQSQRHGARFSRVACVDNARSLLESFLALYNLDPAKAIMDNSVKLTGFTALAAAVVVFLNLLADHPTSTVSESGNESDRILIRRTIEVLQTLSEGQPRSLCGQCHQALADLIHSSQTLNRGGSRQIAVPYFGLVEISRGGDHEASTNSSGTHEQHMASLDFLTAEPDPGVENNHVSDLSDNDPLAFPTFFDDVVFTYEGPWGIPDMESFWPGPTMDYGVD